MRTQRSSSSTNYIYSYDGTTLVQMTVGSNVLIFSYGINGQPMSVNYNGTDYYYVTNMQGDVIRILNSSGTVVVSYIYDAWGNIIYTSGSMATTLGAQNPLRYRGYVYDQETGLYYLQTRYYDPEICRFISADSVIPDVGSSVQGYNMFTYCFNNPVNMADNSGHWPQWIKDVVNWLNNNIIHPVVGFVQDVAEDISNYALNNESEENVLESNYFSSYKGSLVIKTPFDASFSFGVIGLSIQQQDTDTLRHEYGHIVQMKNIGIGSYLTDVAIPSIMINMLERKGKLPYDYYSYPWEAEANILGGATLSQIGKPSLPQGQDVSYWDLIQLFFS